MTNPAAIPQPIDDLDGDRRWMSMHNRFVKEASRMASRCGVLFIGDSLIVQLKETKTWSELFEPFGSLNFGIGGDSTQHVLWRIQNGELENISPKVVVLLVGTNNVAHTPSHTAGNIVEGIESIVWYINGINPRIKVLVLALLPRGEHPNPFRVKILDINSQLENIVRNIPNATFLNVDPGFVRSDETISPDDMEDYLHLTRSGYKKLGKPIHEAIVKLVRYS